MSFYRFNRSRLLVGSLALLLVGTPPLSFSAELDSRYLGLREEEIRIKQGRADDLNYRIEALQKQMEQEQSLMKQSNEKIWKEFSQNLEIEKRELQQKMNHAQERQAMFERELERKGEQDQVRMREKEMEMKRLILDLERLRHELEEDRRSFDQLKLSYDKRQHQAHQELPGESQPSSGGGEVLSNGSVRVAKITGRQALGTLPFQTKEVQPEYHIAMGDILNIEVWRNPDLSKRVGVRPDGRISLPLAGDIEVVGISLVELRDTLTKSFSEYIREPQVTISLEGFGGRKFIILGEISSPGVYRFQESMTLIEAIALAGGFTRASHQGKVMIIRGDVRKNPQVKIINANAANILRKGMLSENLTIMPNDIIYLGKDFLGDYRDVLNDIVDPAMDTAIDFFVLRSAIRQAQERTA